MTSNVTRLYTSAQDHLTLLFTTTTTTLNIALTSRLDGFIVSPLSVFVYTQF